MMEIRFRHISFNQRLSTMLKVDFRRMFTMPLLYIMVGACFAMPVLILVMTTMMDGTVSVNPQTGAETVVEGFDNAWQIIGSLSSSSAMSMNADSMSSASMDMGLTSMCNINMLYFFVAVLTCIFISDDFRSGYAKNLFTVRANKGDYIVSKIVVSVFGGALMILAFFFGSLIGSAVSSLSFEMVGFSAFSLFMCLLSKIALVSVFVPIYVCMGIIGRKKLWMSLLLSLMVGMFMFMMIPMLTPLDATPLHVLMCLAGGAMFSFGLGIVSKKVLSKVSLV